EDGRVFTRERKRAHGQSEREPENEIAVRRVHEGMVAITISVRLKPDTTGMVAAANTAMAPGRLPVLLCGRLRLQPDGFQARGVRRQPDRGLREHRQPDG